MGYKYQRTDCIQLKDQESITPSTSANGTSDGTSQDVVNCAAPYFIVNITTLANNKTLTLKVQHSDSSSSGFEDVDEPGSQEVQVSANGPYKVYYAGNKRYARLRVVSNEASPAATISSQCVLDTIDEKPDNVSYA